MPELDYRRHGRVRNGNSEDKKGYVEGSGCDENGMHR